MEVYKVSFIKGPSGNLILTKNGFRLADTPQFLGMDRELAQKFADVMNIAFAEGKAAQKLETEAPLLAALCE